MTLDADARSVSGGNTAIFLLLFLLSAAVTYIAFLAMVIPGGRMLILVVCYALMTLACFLRGRAINFMWLIAFPIAALVFDLFFVPIVPTILNIVTLVLAFSMARKGTS